MTPLGTNLHAARLDAGATHRQLGDMAGLASSTISTIETGKASNPGVYTLYAVAIALGVRMEDLMGVPRIEMTTKGRSRVRRKDGVERERDALRAAAKRVLEADMAGVRDLAALNALEDAAGFSQQGQRRRPCA